MGGRGGVPAHRSKAADTELGWPERLAHLGEYNERRVAAMLGTPERLIALFAAPLIITPTARHT